MPVLRRLALHVRGRTDQPLTSTDIFPLALNAPTLARIDVTCAAKPNYPHGQPAPLPTQIASLPDVCNLLPYGDDSGFALSWDRQAEPTVDVLATLLSCNFAQNAQGWAFTSISPLFEEVMSKVAQVRMRATTSLTTPRLLWITRPEYHVWPAVTNTRTNSQDTDNVAAGRCMEQILRYFGGSVKEVVFLIGLMSYSNPQSDSIWAACERQGAKKGDAFVAKPSLF